MTLKLPEHVHGVMDDMYEQRLKKPIATLRLPCTDKHKYREPVLVQIHEARDQRITCPKCGKSHYLIWSKIQDNARWQK